MSYKKHKEQLTDFSNSVKNLYNFPHKKSEWELEAVRRKHSIKDVIVSSRSKIKHDMILSSRWYGRKST